jgi:YD repeat-containing protein
VKLLALLALSLVLVGCADRDAAPRAMREVAEAAKVYVHATVTEEVKQEEWQAARTAYDAARDRVAETWPAGSEARVRLEALDARLSLPIRVEPALEYANWLIEVYR